MKYNLSLPTSVEPVGGFTSNANIEFAFENKGEEIVKNSIRLNGTLVINKTDASGTNPLSLADKPILDPDAGVHGFISQIVTSFGTSTGENLLNYPRFVKAKNEAKKYQIDSCTETHSMCEHMTFSNDANIAPTDIKTNAYSGVIFPTIKTGNYELPFSVCLDFCLNNSKENIPFSKTGMVKIKILLEQMNKTGFMALAGGANTVYSYSLNNLELRYMTEPEKESYGGIVLETKTSMISTTIKNKLASIEFQATNAFDSVVTTLIRGSAVLALDNKTINYLQSEPIVEQVDTFEVKINGENDFLQYPLKYQGEIIYNYLKAFKPYIHAYDDTRVDKHGLSYKKLAQAGQKAGYGLGCAFDGGHDSGTRVQLNLSLKDVPADTYQCFTYTIGRLII